jgi:predicted nuclease of predicted toxin-antitoxin system
VKFLVDECTGLSVSRKLAQLGFDSVSVIESMKGASDEDVLQKAVEENRVIITNDKYFSRQEGLRKLPGIIILRLKDESTRSKVKVVSYVISAHSKAIPGNILIVSEKRIRARRIKS